MGDSNFTIKEVFEWIVHVLGNKFLSPPPPQYITKDERDRERWMERRNGTNDYENTYTQTNFSYSNPPTFSYEQSPLLLRPL
jgi:hypothetical protein